MSKLKALLLTQGMHGMVSQVEGLAKALNLNYIYERFRESIYIRFESNYFLWKKKCNPFFSFKKKI